MYPRPRLAACLTCRDSTARRSHPPPGGQASRTVFPSSPGLAGTDIEKERPPASSFPVLGVIITTKATANTAATLDLHYTHYPAVTLHRTHLSSDSSCLLFTCFFPAHALHDTLPAQHPPAFEVDRTPLHNKQARCLPTGD